ncbi:NIPSNAP family protein [Longispora sp. NPDC051575]|uniref:NIPSNAP family protein n=1 Tax=Longispora sp. NPDC051575 TaxID=3154943 RepID=UPI00342DAD57
MSILEIRGYQLRPGVRDTFDRVFRERIRPVSDGYGIDVVRAGPSLDDADGYVLIRAFASLEARARQKDAFYGGPEWLGGLEDEVMAMIASYHTTVIEVDRTEDLRG